MFLHLICIFFQEKECQAREAEEVRKLDMELLHQRAIEAEEEQKREVGSSNTDGNENGNTYG